MTTECHESQSINQLINILYLSSNLQSSTRLLISSSQLQLINNYNKKPILYSPPYPGSQTKTEKDEIIVLKEIARV